MTLSEKLRNAGEFYAAGLFESPERSIFYRYCCAFAGHFEHAAMSPYAGGKLYPCGRTIYRSSGCAVRPSFSYSIEADYAHLARLVPEAEVPVRCEFAKTPIPRHPHTIGGDGYTHSFINYKRILAEGLNGYRRRVEALSPSDFRDGLLVLLAGIEAYRQRCLAHLRENGGDPDLIAALEYTPNDPPKSAYDALVAWNFVYYVDGCDDIGRLDQNLYPYWRGEDLRPVIRELFQNVDANDGWSGALGPDCNELTVQCIDAIHHIRRPNLQLRVTKDTPDEVWEAVYRSLATSCGQPALYNEEAFQKGLAEKFPEIPPEDRERLSFGGCTETMLEGLSCVGSDDAGLHTAWIFDRFMRSSFAIGEFADFDALFSAFCRLVLKETVAMLEDVTVYRKARAKFRPQPVRTLLIDDCIDRQRDFNDGGARYAWSVSNVSGLINVIDSLLAIRTLVYEEARYTPETFMAALDARDPVFLAEARRCPCWGVDDDRADKLGTALADVIYSAFDEVECYPSGKYFPVSNQFTTTEEAGRMVGPTPDGRDPFTPTCDSFASVHGKDTAGPTALLNSVAKLPLEKVLGTPVMNLRIAKANLPTVLRPLTEAFFAGGGMQLQISSLSREEILDALAHPERHENLIVRVGGFSEYFNRLSPALKQDVLNRTEY